MPSVKKRNRFRLFFWLIIIVLLFAAYKIFGPNTGSMTRGQYLYIHTGAGYENLIAALKDGDFIADMESFGILAKQVQLQNHIHPGKYTIKRGMSNYNIIRMLRSGRQTPVRLVINKLRTQKDFIMLLSQNLEADSFALNNLLHDGVYLSQFGLDTNTVMCGVMQDTYDFYWNTPADKAFRKIEKNYEHYWTDEKKDAAQRQGLTPLKAIILASIVDEETNKNDEKPTIASVYLNRLHNGMKLQADPTVKFANGDFTVRRITGDMLYFPSLYNTYMNEGLPPGPICTPAVSSIEAVLYAPRTKYLFFCAKEDFSGYHNFAATDEEQVKNAHAYQQALNARGIH